MPDLMIILLAAIFLPLFPLSMVFNALFDKLKYAWLRVLVLIAWPLIGVLIVVKSNSSFPEWIPEWVIPLALSTSLLYSLRLLTLRDVNQWSGFLATSLWALLWLPLVQGASVNLLVWFAIGMSLPLVLLVLLSAFLEKRFGAAYTGLYGGLARTVPRFTAILITVIAAAVATPLFPTFFILFDMVVETLSIMPLAAMVLLVIWLLLSWAGALLVQGLIVGRESKVKVADFNYATIGLFSIALLALMISGIYTGMVIL